MRPLSIDPSCASSELFKELFALDLLRHSPPLWWPHAGSFEVVLGAVLTQNTTWKKVEISLENLSALGLDELRAWEAADAVIIREAIKPSGLYATKTRYLMNLTHAIIQTYGTFEHFRDTVDRSWLLSQKGIGFETADAILCYGCLRPVMVVDRYTARLLARFGFEMEGYLEIQRYLAQGIEADVSKIEALYGRPVNLNELYAHFHGMIVEYSKR